MKPFYKSKKFWVACVTASAAVAAFAFGGDKGQAIATLLTVVGSALIGGFGLEDHGKAAASASGK